VGAGAVGRIFVSLDGRSFAFNYARKLSELYVLPRLEP